MSVLDPGGTFGGEVPDYITATEKTVSNPADDYLPKTSGYRDNTVSDMRRQDFFDVVKDVQKKEDTQQVVGMVSDYSTPEKSSVPSTKFKLSPEQQEDELKRVSSLAEMGSTVNQKYESGETEVEVLYDDKHSNKSDVGGYFKAKIVKANKDDQTYEIEWDEPGESESKTETVPFHYVRDFTGYEEQEKPIGLKEMVKSTVGKLGSVFKSGTQKLQSIKKSVQKKVLQITVNVSDSLKSALQKLVGLAENFTLSKTLLELITQENKNELFGKIHKKCKIKVRTDLVELFDAGKYQGPTLYGLGSGVTNVPNVGQNYCTYLDNREIPMCWALMIPLCFMLGGIDKKPKDLEDDSWKPRWPGKSGGGTNHEMEHAIKCVTQSLLNCLAQNSRYNKKDEEIVTHNLLKNILESLNIQDPKGSAKIICKMIRKQQVIAGLPSCSLFNQIKCDVDLIKITLVKLSDNQEWFGIQLSPDENEIRRLVQGILSDGNVKLTFCNFFGIKEPEKSAWKDKETLKSVYELGKLKELLNNDENAFNEYIDKIYALKEMSEDDMVQLILSQTQKVCNEYNVLYSLNENYSAICVACSVLLLDVQMNNVYSAADDLQLGITPQIDKLACKARDYLMNCGLQANCLNYDALSDYNDFMAKVENNPVTSKYLKFDNPADKWTDGSLLGELSGGGDFPLQPDEEYTEDFDIGKPLPQSGERESDPVSPVGDPSKDEPKPIDDIKAGMLQQQPVVKDTPIEPSVQTTSITVQSVSDDTPVIRLFNNVHDMLCENFYPLKDDDDDNDSNERLLEFILSPYEDDKQLSVYSSLHSMVSHEIYNPNVNLPEFINELDDALDDETMLDIYDNLDSHIEEEPDSARLKLDFSDIPLKAELKKKPRKKKKDQTKKKPTKKKPTKKKPTKKKPTKKKPTKKKPTKKKPTKKKPTKKKPTKKKLPEETFKEKASLKKDKTIKKRKKNKDLFDKIDIFVKKIESKF